MRARLEFDLTDSDDVSTFRRATKASEAFSALWDISQEIFRPARKHGYPDSVPVGELSSRETEIIHCLETRFYQILEERDINLDRDWE